MRRRVLALALVLCMVLTLMPTVAFAAGADYAVKVLISASDKQYDSRNTLLLEFQVKTQNDVDIANQQSVAIAYDATLFEVVRTNLSGALNTASLGTSFVAAGSNYSSVLEDWENKLYAAKDGDTGYLLLQPSRGEDLDFSGLKCPSFTTVQSVLLALKGGKSLADVTSTSIRVIKLAEKTTLNQSACAWVSDGTDVFLYGGSSDTLAAPTVEFSGFTPAKPDLEGTVTISGTEVFGNELTATVSGNQDDATLAYQWYRGETAIEGATGNKYTSVAADVGSTLTVKVTDSSGIYGKLIEDSTTGAIDKADCATSAVTTVVGTITDTTVGYTATSGQEYAIVANDADESTITSWESDGSFTGLTANTPYDIYTRVEATDTHKASAAVKTDVSTKKAPGAGDFTYTVKTAAYDREANAATVTSTTHTENFTLYYTGTGDTTYDKSDTAPTAAGKYTLTVDITAHDDYVAANDIVLGTWEITKVALTLPSAAVTAKGYDGTTDATITPGTLSGVISGDTVTVKEASIAGTFGNANVGSSITVTTTNIFTLEGADAANYTLTQPTSLTGTINAADYTDATTTTQDVIRGDGNFEVPEFTGVGGESVEGDTTYTYLSETKSYDQIKAALAALETGATASIGYSFTATNSNYVTTAKTGTIAVTIIDVAFTMGADKATAANSVTIKDSPTYGDTWAEIVTIKSGIVAKVGATGDGGTGVYSLDVSGTPDAGDSQTYKVIYNGTINSKAYTNVTVFTGMVDIDPKTLTSSDLEYKGSAITKEYNGDTACALTQITVKDSAIVGSDSKNIAGTAVYNSKDVATAAKVVFTPTAITTGNYSLAATETLEIAATITPKTLTGLGYTGVTVTKVYDGTTAAGTVGGTAIEFTGKAVDSDVVSIKAVAGVYDNANAETDKDIELTLSLEGAAAGNYKLASYTADFAAAAITAKPLTLKSATAKNRAYDTTNAVEISAVEFNEAAPVPALGTGFTAAGVMADANAGDDKAVTATITLSDSNYSLATATIATTVDIAKADSDVGTVSYGSTDKIFTSTSVATVNAKLTKTGSTAGTIALDATSFVEVATKDYAWTFTPTDATNYKVATGTVSLTVSPNPLVSISIGSTVPTDKNYEYGDTFDKTGLTVTATYDNGDTLDVTDSVTVAYENGTAFSVGDTKVILSYTVDGVTQTCDVLGLTVEKKNIDVSAAAWDYTTAFTFDGTEKAVAVKNLPASAVATYTGVAKATNAGSYTAGVTFALASDYSADNYVLSATTLADCIWVINKATASSVTTAVSEAYKYTVAGDKTTTLPALPEDSGDIAWTITGTTDTKEILSGTPTVADGVVSYTLSKKGVATDSAIINVKAVSTNYEDVTYTLTITMSDKNVPTVTVDNVTTTYNGAAVANSLIKGTAVFDGSAVAGSFAFATATTDAGIYINHGVVFTPDDTTEYDNVSKNITLTINKANLSGTPTYTQITEAGKTLADAALAAPAGGFLGVDKTTPVAGTLEWVDGASTEVVANTAYGWTFTPSDANYNVLTGTITPYRTGGGGGAVVTTVTVPVSGEESTIKVDVTIKGTTAQLAMEPDELDAVLGSDVESGIVEIDLSGLGDKVDTAVIPAAAAKAIKDAMEDEDNDVEGITIVFANGEFTLDAEVMTDILEQASGDVTISLVKKDVNKLNSAQKGAIPEQLENVLALEISIKVGNKEIEEFDGEVVVGIDYSLAEGQSAKGVKGYFVGTDGTMEERNGHYSGGKFYMELEEHFSTYIVAYDEEAAFELPFVDVAEGDWFYDNVTYVYKNGLMNGISDTKFDPQGSMTRAMFVTTLYRVAGEPEVTAANPFTDVAEGKWFTDAIIWAAETGVVKGMGEGIFAPDAFVTREQMATILTNYCTSIGEGPVGAWAIQLTYTDLASVSDWAGEGVMFATLQGWVSGYPDGSLKPQNTATRAETAAMLQRFVEGLAE